MKISRRSMLKTSIAAAAVAAVTENPILAAKKEADEVRIVYLGGDYWHNGMMQERNIRGVLGNTPKNWRLFFAQTAGIVTPEVLADTDLLMICRYSGTDTQGFSTERMVEHRPESTPFMTDEFEAAIISNVKRGMGYMSIHCGVWNGEKKGYMDLIGVEKPYMHTKVQPTLLHDLNPTHPITKGIPESMFGDDEIFSADLIPGKSEVLFKLKGEEQPQDKAGGWCREEGKGRVVALLPGHQADPYHDSSYKEILWRSIHWAMKKDIPPSDFAKERNYKTFKS